MTPGPRGFEVVPVLLALRRDPLRVFLGARARWGDVVRFPLGTRTFYLVGHHAPAHRVLCENARNYTKDTWSYGLLRGVLGEGLLTSDGDEWRRQRRVAQPAFHPSQLESLRATIIEGTDAMVARWRPGVVIDLGAELTRLTLDVVSRAVFGVDLGEDAEAVGRHLGAALEHLQWRTVRLVDWPESWPLPQNIRFRTHMRALDAIVLRIIEARRHGNGAGLDLVAALLATDDRLGDVAIRDQVKTFLLAGHETSANLLTWTFALLGKHPDAARRVLEEADVVLAGAQRTYTRCVLDESMRLYPPIWLVERRAVADDILAGCPIPAGSPVAICQYVLHRDPEVWPDPGRFDPERFAASEHSGRPMCAFLPFGAGLRTCIGEAFARMEAELVLARVVQRVRLEPLEPVVPRPAPYVTLRPQSAVRMRVLGLAGARL